MPSASHGGVLYYVVAVPKERAKVEELRPGAVPEAEAVRGPDSTDSGWDNPFRPDGDLSREADEIVELIKGGKPITPTPSGVAGTAVGAASPGSPAREGLVQQQHSSPVTSTPHKNGANGNAALGRDKAAPGSVSVTRGTVSGGDPAQVEHVTIKKKPKCKCCIVQ